MLPQSTVLLVDDSAEDRATFKRYLLQATDRSYFCVEAETARAGLEACYRYAPDCVVLDHGLPDMDGLVFLDEARAVFGPLPFPVVMATGAGDERIAVAALTHGAQDYLSKGATSAGELQRAVRNAIDTFALQRELVLQRERSTAILESITDAFYSLDVEWRLTYINGAAEQLLQRSRDRLLGRVLWDEFPHARASIWFESYHRAVETQTVVNFQAYIADRERWFDVRAYPSPIGLSIYFRDITEQRRAEHILIESELRFRATFDQVAVGMAHVAPDGRWLRVNRRLCEIVGYSASELAELRFQDLTYPDDLPTDTEYAARMLSGALDTYSIEKRYIRKDGSLIWINLTVALVRDGAGTPLYFISVVEDIEDRKRARAQLERREMEAAFLAEAGAALSNSLDLAATGATVTQLLVGRLADWCVLDLIEPTGQIQRVAAHSDPAKAALVAQLTAAPADMPQRDGDPENPLLTTIRSGQPLLLPTLPPDVAESYSRSEQNRGIVRALAPHSVLVLPLLARGQLIGALTLVRSTTVQPYADADVPFAEELARRAAMALDNARLYAEAQETIRIREMFLTVAAHELRTPLTTLSGTLDLLRRRVAREPSIGEREAKMLLTIAQQTQRLKTLTNQMLSSAQQVAEREPLELRTVDLMQLVATVVVEVRPTLYNHTLEFTAGAPLPVAADAAKLSQAVQHLLSNAVKYSPHGGVVAIEVAERGDSATIVVSDAGMGVPASALPHIFERFYRAANINPLEISGFGIGLYLARQIVEQHGGSLGVESTEGAGSRFTITLPLGAPSESATPD